MVRPGRIRLECDLGGGLAAELHAPAQQPVWPPRLLAAVDWPTPRRASGAGLAAPFRRQAQARRSPVLRRSPNTEQKHAQARLSGIGTSSATARSLWPTRTVAQESARRSTRPAGYCAGQPARPPSRLAVAAVYGCLAGRKRVSAMGCAAPESVVGSPADRHLGALSSSPSPAAVGRAPTDS